MVIASRSHKLLFFLLIYLSVSSLILSFSLAICLYIFKGTQIFGPILQIGGDRMMFEGAGETFFLLLYCYVLFAHYDLTFAGGFKGCSERKFRIKESIQALSWCAFV